MQLKFQPITSGIALKIMIKSIPSFKESELESVILWNRILVYATLYGQAKKVSDVLKTLQHSPQ